MRPECKLSIITVNYNGLNDTCALIESISFNENMEVIVIDNASIQDEASIIAKRYPQVKTIRRISALLVETTWVLKKLKAIIYF